MAEHKNLNHTTFKLLKCGLTPVQIKKKLKLKSMSVLSYHLKKLNSAGLVEHLDVGVWEVNKNLSYGSAMEIYSVKTYQPQKVTPSGQVQIGKSYQADKFKSRLQLPLNMAELPPNTNRGHGYRFKVDIPSNAKWKSKRKILESKKIKIIDIGHNWLGEQFHISDDFTIQLTTKSVNIIFSRDYSLFHENPYMIHAKAVFVMKQKIKEVERILGFSLKIYGKYHFRPTQSHYALIKNALAKVYNKNKMGLKVYDDNGLWLIIDDSFNFNELECVRVDTNKEESIGMQDIMNSYNRVPLTSEQTLQMISENARQLGYFGSQMVAHVDIQKTTTQTLKELSQTMTELKDFVKDNYKR